MSNELKVSMKDVIKSLSEKGCSNREIARLLDIHRNSVNKYVRLENSKYATVSPGNSGVEASSKCAKVPAGNCAAGKCGRSRCEPFRAAVEDMLKLGLSAQRIYQYLVCGHGYSGGYDSVKRFVRGIESRFPLSFRRMECLPGEEMQVDFGSGAPLLDAGVRRRTHLFRSVMSCSRKGYSESVMRQTAEDFIRVLENSFRHFGGVPCRVVIDNLKAGVSNADWFDPELNPKLADFCRHYGTFIVPTRPGIPRHKGKIERGVGYVKSNALKGRVFASLAEQNKYLSEWERDVADKRIHGTTREQVCSAFEREKPFLKELPPDLFPCFEEGRRTVHRDGYVEVRGAYYSVPPEYTGSEVWVRWDSRMVKVFNKKNLQITIHVRKSPGKFSTKGEHIHEKKKSRIEEGQEWLLKRIAVIGTCSEAWAKAMLANRGEIGLRVLLGLHSMARKNTASEIESGCRRALDAGEFRLRDVRKFMVQDCEQGSFEFLDEHPLIRKMDFYGEIVKQQEEKNERNTADGNEETQAVRDGTEN